MFNIIKCLFNGRHKTRRLRIVSEDICEVRCSVCFRTYEQKISTNTLTRLTSSMKKINDPLAEQYLEKYSINKNNESIKERK